MFIALAISFRSSHEKYSRSRASFQSTSGTRGGLGSAHILTKEGPFNGELIDIFLLSLNAKLSARLSLQELYINIISRAGSAFLLVYKFNLQDSSLSRNTLNRAGNSMGTFVPPAFPAERIRFFEKGGEATQ
jgi:hypothetical protein